ncbi:MAG TPA: PT domain-containing protein [Tepidisphaeraceae bacterium]|nr:PT domain-containing protein [Tepidisphaeraceae bacterium]
MGSYWMIWVVVGFLAWWPVRRMVFGGRWFFYSLLLLSPSVTLAQYQNNGPQLSIRYMKGSILDGGPNDPGVFPANDGGGWKYVMRDENFSSGWSNFTHDGMWSGPVTTAFEGAYGQATVFLLNFGTYYQGTFYQGKVGSSSIRKITVQVHFPADDLPYCKFMGDGVSGTTYGGATPTGGGNGMIYPEGYGENNLSEMFAHPLAKGYTYTNYVACKLSYLDGNIQPTLESTTQPTTNPTSQPSMPTSQPSPWLSDAGGLFFGRGKDTSSEGLIDAARAAAGSALPADTEQQLFGPRAWEGATAAPDWSMAKLGLDKFRAGLGLGNPQIQILGMENLSELYGHVLAKYEWGTAWAAPLLTWVRLLSTITMCVYCALNVLEKLAWGLGMRHPENVRPPLALTSAD